MKIIILITFLMMKISTSFGNELVPTEVLVSESHKLMMMEGGNSSSVGGDSIDRRYMTAWFYGGKSIVTCYNYIESFGISELIVKKNILSAFEIWKKYFRSKKINKNNEKSVNVNFKLKGKCSGGEDLRLYFGTGPIFGNIKDLKIVQTLSMPIAYVNKTYIDRSLNWGRGYIRFFPHGYYSNEKEVFPDWKKKGSLETIILHELGHVLGFDHITNTIMDKAIGKRVFLTSNESPVSIEIDQREELVTCENCKRSYAGKIVDLSMRDKIFGKDGKIILVKNGDDFILKGPDFEIKMNMTERPKKTYQDVMKSNFSSFEEKQISIIYKGNFYSPLEKRKRVFILYYNQGNTLKDSILELSIVDQSKFLSLGVFQ